MGVELMDLWLPILLSAVFVFVASSIIHMAIPIHKGDYKRLPGEADGGAVEVPSADPVELDPEVRKALEALGYVGD